MIIDHTCVTVTCHRHRCCQIWSETMRVPLWGHRRRQQTQLTILNVCILRNMSIILS